VSELLDRARARIPGGVNSPVRAFGAVGGEPFFVARAEGAHLWTTEGRRLCDYVQSWGASILGHAHPRVVEAITKAAADGTSYGAPTEREVELAEAIAERVPSVEKVRLVSSGTEAAMSALRLARGASGREAIVKFAGAYHGHADALLAAAGSGVATFGLPGSAGVPRSAVEQTVVVPWNDPAALDTVLAARDVAAVILEPVPANMGLVPAAPGFLEHVADTTRRHGALLIFDEVITGFRLGLGGAPAAFGGRADVMDQLAPLGPVYQAGTLSGNPLATAAGLAVLAELDAGSYDALERSAARLADGLRQVVAPPVQVSRVGTLVGLFFNAAPVIDYDTAKTSDTERYARFFHGLLDAGTYVAPSTFEALFVSLAHTDADLDRTVELAADAAREIA